MKPHKWGNRGVGPTVKQTSYLPRSVNNTTRLWFHPECLRCGIISYHITRNSITRHATNIQLSNLFDILVTILCWRKITKALMKWSCQFDYYILIYYNSIFFVSIFCCLFKVMLYVIWIRGRTKRLFPPVIRTTMTLLVALPVDWIRVRVFWKFWISLRNSLDWK